MLIACGPSERPTIGFLDLGKGERTPEIPRILRFHTASVDFGRLLMSPNRRSRRTCCAGHYGSVRDIAFDRNPHPWERRC